MNTMIPLQIHKYPHKVLSTKSQEVDILGDDRAMYVQFITAMYDFYTKDLKWGAPVGLAAPQVGRNYRIFIALGELYINPVVLWKPQGGKKLCLEGCYSLKENKFNYKVWRDYAIKLRWQDINGEFHEKKFKQFEAQVIQHELAHLSGMCLVDELETQAI